MGVLTDEAVMEKKPCPTVSFCDRLRLVGALSCVDAAVAQATYSPLTNILEIGPDVLFESVDHEVRTYPEFKGRILAMPYYPGVSSSEIKHRIQEKED